MSPDSDSFSDYEKLAGSMSPAEARAWALVYHPNISSIAHESIVRQLSNGKVGREIHAMAIEGCLLSIKQHLNALRAVEAEIMRLRSKTAKKVRGKLTKRARKIAKQGMENRAAYWDENAKPLVQTLEKNLDTFSTQLWDTHIYYEDLATNGRTQLQHILEIDPSIDPVPETSNVFTIAQIWENITTALQTTIQYKDRQFSELGQEVYVIQRQLKHAIQRIQKGRPSDALPAT